LLFSLSPAPNLVFISESIETNGTAAERFTALMNKLFPYYAELPVE
jgi:hypothetical protein